MALRVRFTHPLRSFVATADLTVEHASTVALVGPSGAGKTTVLRVVAGLLRPKSGHVALDDTVLLDTERGIDIPPEHRRVGYLFQEYALFPHLDVIRNVRFGARRHASVLELLDRFSIGDLAKARVRELSGGERQRVALARALARDPALLLLDEPLSALDTHTRAGVRAELRQLLDTLGLPTILVTHDFEDAATLAHRVGVISDGRILQLGSPSDLVSLPNDAFVASFTGASLFPGQAIETVDGLTKIALESGLVVWSADRASGPVNVAVYPWDVSLGGATPDDSRHNHLRSSVISLAPMGNRVRVRVGPFVAEITAASAARLDLRPGVLGHGVVQGHGGATVSALGDYAGAMPIDVRPPLPDNQRAVLERAIAEADVRLDVLPDVYRGAWYRAVGERGGRARSACGRLRSLAPQQARCDPRVVQP